LQSAARRRFYCIALLGLTIESRHLTVLRVSRSTSSPPGRFLKPPTGCRMPKTTFRVVTRGADGSLRIKDYPDAEPLLKMHTQIGIDDCSTDLGLRGLPIFRGLVGPMPEGKTVIRYESPEVFETLTKEWTSAKTARRRRRTILPEGQPEATPPAM
jgi:hypothetical protein